MTLNFSFLNSISVNDDQILIHGQVDDQTNNTMPTLEYGKYIFDRFIYPTLDYGFYSARKNYPIVSRIIKELFGKKFRSKKKQLDLLDTDLFRKYRKYMIYLFKKL